MKTAVRLFNAPLEQFRCKADRKPLKDGSGARCMHKKIAGYDYCREHIALAKR
jgi:hypothetical protein